MRVTFSRLQELTLVVFFAYLFQFIIFEQVILYFCLLHLVYCIIDLFLGVFHSSFTSAFSLSCTDLCKVSTEDSDHGIPYIAILIAEIEGHCIYIQYCICLMQV